MLNELQNICQKQCHFWEGHVLVNITVNSANQISTCYSVICVSTGLVYVVYKWTYFALQITSLTGVLGGIYAIVSV